MSGYIEILEDTLLAFRLPAFEGKLRVRERKHPKLYWIDPGLVRAMGNRFGSLYPEERGVLFEGWMASLLRAHRDYTGLFDDFYYWAPATARQTEVDFLLRRDDRYHAIATKSSAKVRDAHLKGLRTISGLKGWMRRTLVYLGHTVMKTEDGIDIWPLEHFLQRLVCRTLFGKRTK